MDDTLTPAFTEILLALVIVLFGLISLIGSVATLARFKRTISDLGDLSISEALALNRMRTEAVRTLADSFVVMVGGMLLFTLVKLWR